MAIKTFTCSLSFFLLVFLSAAQKFGSVEITIENDSDFIESPYAQMPEWELGLVIGG